MQTTIYFLMVLVLYFLPTFIATSGRKASVFVVNLFFAWTMIGWAIALYMAIRSRENVKEAA